MQPLRDGTGGKESFRVSDTGGVVPVLDDVAAGSEEFGGAPGPWPDVEQIHGEWVAEALAE